MQAKSIRRKRAIECKSNVVANIVTPINLLANLVGLKRLQPEDMCAGEEPKVGFKSSGSENCRAVARA